MDVAVRKALRIHDKEDSVSSARHFAMLLSLLLVVIVFFQIAAGLSQIFQFEEAAKAAILMALLHLNGLFGNLFVLRLSCCNLLVVHWIDLDVPLLFFSLYDHLHLLLFPLLMLNRDGLLVLTCHERG